MTLGEGRELAARLLVDDRRSGLILLKVDAAGLPFLMPLNPPPQIGEEVTWTYSIGAKNRAAARGIIAATGRELQGLGTNLLQLDGEVANGSRGRPVVDEQGHLVGIIAFSRVAAAQRIGFAVPASAVQTLLDVRRGEGPVVVERGTPGIVLTQVRSDGPVVARPTTGSPALAAGIRDGDEVLAIDDVKVGSPQEIFGRRSPHTAGNKVKVTIRREGKEQEFEVTLVPPQSPIGNPPVRAPRSCGLGITKSVRFDRGPARFGLSRRWRRQLMRCRLNPATSPSNICANITTRSTSAARFPPGGPLDSRPAERYGKETRSNRPRRLHPATGGGKAHGSNAESPETVGGTNIEAVTDRSQCAIVTHMHYEFLTGLGRRNWPV